MKVFKINLEDAKKTFFSQKEEYLKSVFETDKNLYSKAESLLQWQYDGLVCSSIEANRQALRDIVDSEFCSFLFSQDQANELDVLNETNFPYVLLVKKDDRSLAAFVPDEINW